MANWKNLTVDDLRLVLSEDEIEKLSQLSLSPEMATVIQDTIDLISDTWRGALSAKGMALDPREHFIPSTYAYWVCVHARHAVWTRFPNSGFIALDEVRKDELKKAMELLKQPMLDVPVVEWDTDPELSAFTRPSSDGCSLLTPFLRFPEDRPVIENFALPSFDGSRWRMM